MIKCLVALVLVAVFSASALAASEKAKTRPQQRHPSEHLGRQMQEHKPDDNSYWRRSDNSRWQREYWEPCNSTFREYYSWGCTGN